MIRNTILVRAADRMRRLMIHATIRTQPVPMTRLGSDYGGWWVPNGVLARGGIAYCAGAGEDITFDLSLHQLGFSVHCFDPTPRAIAHVNAKKPQDGRFAFHAIGWWDKRTSLRFYVPRNPQHVSHSVVNLQGTTDFFEADVDTVPGIMSLLGHVRLSLVKMDIEGAEIRVLASLLEADVRPEVLCVEFDQPQPFHRTVKAVRSVLQAGYRLRRIEGWNFTFQFVTAEAMNPQTPCVTDQGIAKGLEIQ